MPALRSRLLIRPRCPAASSMRELLSVMPCAVMIAMASSSLLWRSSATCTSFANWLRSAVITDELLASLLPPPGRRR
eukprot:scaffold112744_cov52-Phaeocystis_antarctica.AAC.1